jgi:hypothetical protein
MPMNGIAIGTWALILLGLIITPGGATVSVLPEGDHYVGDVIRISGTTTFSPGNVMLIEVESLSFGPTNKSAGGAFSGTSGTAEVVEQNGVNTWSFEVDTTGFQPDEYLVRVEVLEAGVVETTTFTLLEAPTATSPAGTTVPATAPATPSATTATPVPSPTPAGSPLPAALLAAAVIAAGILLRR